MIGFEMFDIGSWMDGILIKEAPQDTTPRKDRSEVARADAKRRLMLSAGVATAVALATALVIGPTAVQSSHVTTIRPQTSGMKAADLARDGYWSELMTGMGNWRRSELPEVHSQVDAFV